MTRPSATKATRSASVIRASQITWSKSSGVTRSWTFQRPYYSSTTVRRPFTTFRLGVWLGQIANYAKVDLRRFQPEEFTTRSTLGKRVWHGVNDPLTELEKFFRTAAKKPETLHEFAEAALAEAKELEKKEFDDCNGVTEYVETTKGHQYVTVSRGVEIPASLCGRVSDLEADQPFFDMIACFPPYGTLIPRGLTDGSENREQQAVVAHVREHLAQRKPPEGLAALGDSSTIAFSGYTAARLGRLTVRFALANTTRWHVFDGRVLWMLVIDSLARRMYFVGLGAGTHRWHLVDGINSVLGGVVFTTMIRTYGHWLRMHKNATDVRALQDGLAWDSPLRLELLDEVGKAEPELETTRALLSVADFFGEFAAEMRELFGYDVVGPPDSGAVVEIESDLHPDGEKHKKDG